MNALKLFIILLACLPPAAGGAEDQALAQLFARQGAAGTLVISSLNTGKTYVHDEARARRRFAPASTFKVPNTLIALEEGAVAGKDAVLPWDGQMHDFPDWNRDQTLASAFKVSCVWCYQMLAQRVGAEAYQRYVRRLGYGALRAPFEVATFWLDGALQISAREQVAFLKKLHRRALPFRAATYATLREIMLDTRTPQYALWGKTGLAMRASPQVGWYVGYVEAAKDTWVFALNMDIHGKEDWPVRRQLAKDALRLKGIVAE